MVREIYVTALVYHGYIAPGLHKREAMSREVVMRLRAVKELPMPMWILMLPTKQSILSAVVRRLAIDPQRKPYLIQDSTGRVVST